MNILKRFFSPYKLNKVFTPNTIARLTYVKRLLLEEDLKKYISLPGKQIVVYGHSGSGKTTLVRNILNSKHNFIKVHCESTTTFNDIILQAFDELNKFYVLEKTVNKNYSINSALRAEYGMFASKIESTVTNTQSSKNVRIVPPQLTPHKLAQFLGEVGCIWVIEDFHKIDYAEKKRIADVIKVFIDVANDYPNVKIICIGAVGTARELVELDTNLHTRVAEVLVPLLTDDEILSIITKGCGLLNVKMSIELKNKITYYSNNLAALTHQICYDICYHNKINKSKIFSLTLDDSLFKIAVDSYVRKNSDTFTKLYDSISSEPCGWHILKTFDNLEKEYLSYEEIKSGIPTTRMISDEDLKLFLDKLGSSDYNGLIRFDRNSKKYSISTPFFKAFLKMKLALEKTETNERKNRKRRKKQNMFSIKCAPEMELTLNEEFMRNYYQYLDSYIIRHIKMRNELLQNINQTEQLESNKINKEKD